MKLIYILTDRNMGQRTEMKIAWRAILYAICIIPAHFFLFSAVKAEKPPNIRFDHTISTKKQLYGGLNRFDRKNGKFIHYRHNPNDPDSLGDDRVQAIAIGHQSSFHPTAWD